MFTRKSVSSLSKEAAVPANDPNSSSAPVSILKSQMAFALMEEKNAAGFLQKLSDSQMGAMKHLVEWSKGKQNPMFSVIYAKAAEVTWMWSQVLKETAEQYVEYIKLLQAVFSEERAIEETHKAVTTAQQWLSKAQRNLDGSKKKDAKLQKDFDTAKDNFEMVSKKLLDQIASADVKQLKNVRRSLSSQAQAYLHMSGGCQEIYIKQKLLAGMIPDTEEALKCDNIVKAVECSMNDCLFGLAENMDLWPPEGGGFVKPKQSDESACPTSAPPIPDTDDDNFSFRDSAILNTPPQLPPRTSPSLPRKMELEIEKNANNNNSRLRSVSLTHNDDKIVRRLRRREHSECRVRTEKVVSADDSHLKNWAKLWKKGKRPDSMFNLDLPESQHHPLAKYEHYSSDSDLLSTFSAKKMNGEDSHFLPEATDEGTVEEDPYCRPIDALSQFKPKYVLYKHTPSANPVFLRSDDRGQPKGLVHNRRLHSSLDNIYTEINDSASAEGVYSQPFDCLNKPRKMFREHKSISQTYSVDTSSSRRDINRRSKMSRSLKIRNARDTSPKAHWLIRKKSDMQASASSHTPQTGMTMQARSEEDIPTSDNCEANLSSATKKVLAQEYLCELDILDETCPVTTKREFKTPLKICKLRSSQPKLVQMNQK